MNKKISFRFLTQFFIVAVVFYLAFVHQKFGIEKAAPVDAYCPFGAVESLFTLIFKGEFLKRVFTSSFILMSIFLISTLVLGRVFCGYFCPLGAIQEWIRKIGIKIGFKKELNIPEKIDKYLRFFKYITLAIIVYFSFYLGDLIFRNYDPYNALMHLGKEIGEKPVGYIVLLIIIIVSLFSKNLWCKYLCPLGGFFGIIKKTSPIRIKRDKETCISCGVCDNNCPASLKIKDAKEVKNADCISCGNCIKSCPKNSLSYRIFAKEIKKPYFNVLLIILVILPLIILPQTSLWKTKAESNIVNVKGEINTADIRGSNTLKYVMEVTNVPLSEFQNKLGLPRNVDTSLKLKEMGYKYNLPIETSHFRAVIDNYIRVEEQKVGDCPFGETDCGFPGKCGRYTDNDNNRICDHSE